MNSNVSTRLSVVAVAVVVLMIAVIATIGPSAAANPVINETMTPGATAEVTPTVGAWETVTPGATAEVTPTVGAWETVTPGATAEVTPTPGAWETVTPEVTPGVDGPSSSDSGPSPDVTPGSGTDSSQTDGPDAPEGPSDPEVTPTAPDPGVTPGPDDPVAAPDPAAAQMLREMRPLPAPIDLPMVEDGQLVGFWNPHQPAREFGLPVFAGDEGEPDISASDPVQGPFRICALASSLSAVAGDSPETIRDLILDHGNGTYTVTIYPPGTNEPFVVARYPMMLPVIRRAGAEPFVASLSTGQEVWVALIAQAMAIHIAHSDPRLDYRRIQDVGAAWISMADWVGTTSDCTQIVTNESARQISVHVARSVLRPDYVGELFGRATTVGIPPGPNPADTRIDLGGGRSLVRGHSYSVASVREFALGRLVTLRDPLDNSTTVVWSREILEHASHFYVPPAPAAE